MGGERILLVEDESITRKSLADLLRNEGYELHEASEGAQAMKLFEDRQFDLVITDLVMPEMDGLKLIESIRSISTRIPIILITGYLSSSVAKALSQPPTEFIAKPIEPDVLLMTVKHLLRMV